MRPEGMKELESPPSIGRTGGCHAGAQAQASERTNKRQIGWGGGERGDETRGRQPHGNFMHPLYSFFFFFQTRAIFSFQLARPRFRYTYS